jgi:hypothetical protein
MKQKIEKIKKILEKEGVIWDYDVGFATYGSWGEIIYTCHKNIEKKLSSIFGDSYIGQDATGYFYFWPIDEITNKRGD